MDRAASSRVTIASGAARSRVMSSMRTRRWLMDARAMENDMRYASRFVVKAGELFGEFKGSEFGERVRKVVTRTEDGVSGACMLGGTLVRGLPAVHVSGLGMYGEKWPFSRVVETAIVRTIHLAPDGSINPVKYDFIDVCALLRPDWPTLRYGTPKGECYEELPTWVEFQPIEHIVSIRGVYIEWYRRGMTSFTAEDVVKWLAERTGKSFLIDSQHRRAVNTLLDQVAGVSNAASTHIPNMILDRSRGRWRFAWRVTHRPPSAESAETLAARECGYEAMVCERSGA